MIFKDIVLFNPVIDVFIFETRTKIPTVFSKIFPLQYANFFQVLFISQGCRGAYFGNFCFNRCITIMNVVVFFYLSLKIVILVVTKKVHFYCSIQKIISISRSFKGKKTRFSFVVDKLIFTDQSFGEGDLSWFLFHRWVMEKNPIFGEGRGGSKIKKIPLKSFFYMCIFKTKILCIMV